MNGFVNECVGCEVCHGCGAKQTPCIICDECGEPCARVFEYEGQDLCEGCAQETMNALWADMTLGDKLNYLCWDRDEFATIEGAEVAADEWFEQATLEEAIDIFSDIKEVR